jgi:PIN domain nuclease of toxin-antitoxin system
MKVLIDTHVFIWWTTEPARLSSSVYTLLTDPTTAESIPAHVD